MHKAKLTHKDFAAIEARGAVVHFELASVRRDGDYFLIEGVSGVHTLTRSATDLERLNAHWLGFITKNRYPEQ